MKPLKERRLPVDSKFSELHTQKAMEDKPRIRGGIEAVGARFEGRDVLVLHDRTGMSPEVVLDRGAALLLELMDGAHTPRDMQAALMRYRGLGLVPVEDIQKLVDALDERFLLDNENFRKHKAEIAEAFRREPVRRAQHAGKSYPDDPDQVKEQLSAYFTSPEGPISSNTKEIPQGTPAGLIAPHIDFNRGGIAYAWAYHTLGDNPDADLYVILGTCHHPMEHPFALSVKAFETPLGVTESAGDLAESISERSGIDLFRDELQHRSEFTVEFQVLFLQYILGGKKDFEILPVLCSGFHEIMAQRKLPSGNEPFRKSLDAIHEVLEASGRKICIIASSDLAHLGPQFGDPSPVRETDGPRIRRDDEAMLDWVLKGSADGFYRHVLSEGDRRRICGLAPIYVLLRLLRPGSGRLLYHGLALDPQMTVTFASIGFW